MKWNVQREWLASHRAHLRMLMDGVVVEDRVNDLADRNFCLDGVEETDELLMAVTLHVAADDRAVEDIEGGEQRRRAMAFVIMRHRTGAALLHRQARLGAVERLDLALLINRQHDGVSGRIDIEPDNVLEFGGELRMFDSLNCRTRCGWRPWLRQMRWTELTLMPAVFAIIAPVQWVASPGGSVMVNATTRSTTAPSSGWTREGRVLSRSKPSKPCVAKRSCQRQTQVFDLPVRRMISLVPMPSALCRTISARQTCF